MLISPVDGTVSFTKFWSANQSVVKDEPVISVVPLETGDFLGRINLKMQRSGKVKTRTDGKYQTQRLSISRIWYGERGGKIKITGSFG